MEKGIVLSVNRGVAKVSISEEISTIKFSHKLSIVVGDHVEIENNQIIKVLDRKNIFRRSYFGKVKEIAANLDSIFIVSAVGELFNTLFIDRVKCIADIYDIPAVLIINKIDLIKDDLLIKEYEKIFETSFRTCAKNIDTLEDFKQFINQDIFNQIALTGMSGVGKSTIINQLIPDANARTSAVSSKTGQGVQTTSMAKAYFYNNRLVIDLPGIQSFGVTELLANEIKFGFKEILNFGNDCKYSDCNHDLEDHCAVKKAVENNLISKSRYNNYLHIYKESKLYVRY